MVETNAKKMPLGATPGKLALVGVLAVVFVGVLIFQFGGMFATSPGTDNPPATPTQETTQPVAATPAVVKPAEDREPRPQWSRVKLEDALAYDPFSVSSTLAVLLGPEPEPEQIAGAPLDEAAQMRAARLQETLNALRNHGVSMIFDKGQGPSATVGDQVLEVGDVIGGFRVIEISIEKGVVLEPLEEEDESREKPND